MFEYASDEVLPHLYEKRHLDCIEIESKDRQWIQKAVMAVLGIFKEMWLVLKIYEWIVLRYCTLRRKYRKYIFYLVIEFFCNEIQNLADYGWFLENLGKMPDSENKWRYWVMLLIFPSIYAQYTTFIEISQSYLMNVKNWLSLADF